LANIPTAIPVINMPYTQYVVLNSFWLQINTILYHELISTSTWVQVSYTPILIG